MRNLRHNIYYFQKRTWQTNAVFHSKPIHNYCSNRNYYQNRGNHDENYYSYHCGKWFQNVYMSAIAIAVSAGIGISVSNCDSIQSSALTNREDSNAKKLGVLLPNKDKIAEY